MIKAESLGFERHNKKLFGGLTFEVKSGALLLIKGANGSGKSTLLRVLAGLSQPTAGHVDKISCLYLGHRIGIHPALSAVENLRNLLTLSEPNQFPKGVLVSALRQVGLAGFENVVGESLSRGQNQRIALARLWLTTQRCWILDEPFTGLDSTAQQLLHNKLLRHLEHGGTVVLTGHKDLAIDAVNKQTLVLGEL